MLLAGITGAAAGPGGREGRGPRPRARCRALFRRRRWQWRRPFSPYVAIKCEARSPTRWLAGWLAPFLSLFLEFPLLSRIGGRYLARRAREGGSRALTRDGDLFRLQETFRSLVRESDSRSTSFRPSFLPPLRRAAAVEGDHSFRGRSLRLRRCRAGGVAVRSHGGVVDYANSTGSETRERSGGRGHCH